MDRCPTETTPYGPKDCGQNQEKYISQVATTGLKQYPLIDCHAGIDSVRLMMNTTAKRKAFIAAAVAKMKAQKFEGYNLDIEIGGTLADAVLYTQFVSEFAESLHAAGGVLSSDSKFHVQLFMIPSVYMQHRAFAPRRLQARRQLYFLDRGAAVRTFSWRDVLWIGLHRYDVLRLQEHFDRHGGDYELM